ncbi:hypothetical protein Anapl_04749 [Anas platyrhynchos]|uniref:Uncharacterized protein n=1 Tax=Anas platyrhynchos TaxID=8839 RepID=R0K7G1_ANAPL|nr:hypothetical protein Anapl_04749 [Anas platyrhynchos]
MTKKVSIQKSEHKCSPGGLPNPQNLILEVLFFSAHQDASRSYKDFCFSYAYGELTTSSSYFDVEGSFSIDRVVKSAGTPSDQQKPTVNAYEHILSRGKHENLGLWPENVPIVSAEVKSWQETAFNFNSVFTALLQKANGSFYPSVDLFIVLVLCSCTLMYNELNLVQPSGADTSRIDSKLQSFNTAGNTSPSLVKGTINSQLSVYKIRREEERKGQDRENTELDIELCSENMSNINQ